ncbi:LysR family transcriptional regulator [Mariniluteicoccus flavus]
MDVRHLELLREFADRGTVTAVAEATFRTPSAVSQHLKAAERDLGVRLVEPDGRRLRLTTAGALLAEGATDVAVALARVQAELDRLRQAPGGTVTLGTLPSAGQALVPGLLRRLRDSPIRLVFDDFDLSEDEFGGRTPDHDVVIAHTVAGHRREAVAGLHAEVLATEPIDVALPADHRLAAKERLRPGDVASEPWVGVPVGYPFDAILVAVENATGHELDRVQRVRDNHLVEALVAAGAGLALLPRFTTRPAPGVVTRPLTGVRASRDIVALARRDRAERASVAVVLEALRGAGAELAGQTPA